MSWSYDAAMSDGSWSDVRAQRRVTVPAMWLDAAMSEPEDCPVCGLSDGTSSDGHGLADSAADCLAHWTEPTTDEVNAAIRYELDRLADRPSRLGRLA